MTCRRPAPNGAVRAGQRRKNCASGAFWFTQIGVGRTFQDDLPSLSIPRLRAAGAISAEMTSVMVEVGGELVEVGLYLQKFANGGSWSLFRCPSCGLKARVLRLLEGCVVCRRCCIARGVRPRSSPMGVRQRAERRIPKLKAMLESETSLRLKPHLYGKLERRVRHAAALERCEYIVNRSEFKRQVKEEGDVAVHSKVSAWLRASRSKGG